MGVKLRDGVEQGFCPANMKDWGSRALFPFADSIVELDEMRKALGIFQDGSSRDSRANHSHDVGYQLIGNLQELLVYLLVVSRIVVTGIKNAQCGRSSSENLIYIYTYIIKIYFLTHYITITHSITKEYTYFLITEAALAQHFNAILYNLFL